MNYESKKILIQSELTDRSTSDVLDWIYFLSNAEIERLNDDVEVDTIIISDEGLEGKSAMGSLDFLSNEFSSYWYRRGRLTLADKDTIQDYNRHISSNTGRMIASLPIYPLGKNIGSYSNNSKSKIHNLIIANQCDIKVPFTIFTNNPKELERFKGKKCLIKNVNNDSIFIEVNDQYKCELTFINKLIDLDSLLNRKTYSTSLPAFFQEYVEKKYELRVFYIMGEFYAMAIFSQLNEKTRLDFRNYDKDKPNRNVSFKLPKDIKDNLDRFMKAINMNCGSIDMICTPEDEFVFLEVNPVGQYQWLEGNCNYPISQKIAETLVNQ